ncbi:hypothetical protein GGF49_006185 [Coemansia sp. RSA 1853]|nr:hypothetical protein GGF49_006185 [Coemansia sp. RSA 1853]
MTVTIPHTSTVDTTDYDGDYAVLDTSDYDTHYDGEYTARDDGDYAEREDSDSAACDDSDYAEHYDGSDYAVRYDGDDDDYATHYNHDVCEDSDDADCYDVTRYDDDDVSVYDCDGAARDNKDDTVHMKVTRTGAVHSGALRSEAMRTGAELQIDNLEKQKDNEILRLQDEIASLEIIVEDKVFGKEELNNHIASLTDKLGRLQRGQTDLPAIPTKFSAAASQQRSADLPAGATGAGIGTIVDDETRFCEICESSDHSITDCPEVTSASTIFKQETSVNSSRPYCDNCKSFCGHWTEDCPHGDEMF